MTIEEAITAAIELEHRVHAAYANAAGRAEDRTARRFFEVLAQEERGHIAYLESRLAEWRAEGRLSEVKLGTVLPAKAKIDAEVRRLRQRMTGPRRGGGPQPGDSPELDLLKRALEVEHETSTFYKRMVQELPEEGRRLFSRFLDIEEGHGAIVQAEIDSVTGLGFWFDVQEFKLEAG